MQSKSQLFEENDCKKNDVSIVSLYFSDEEPVVIKFKDREGFQAALKNTLKIIKLRRKQTMSLQK